MRRENETKWINIEKEETIISLLTRWKQTKPKLISKQINNSLVRWLDIR
jgi:hypothetical protein